MKLMNHKFGGAMDLIRSDDFEHHEKVRNRLKLLKLNAPRIAEAISVDRRAEFRFLEQASKSKKSSDRIMWMRRAADAGTKVPSKFAACKKGCSHCCNIAVTLSRTEALHIASEIGLSINESSESDVEKTRSELDISHREIYGTPCVFLKEGSCSIYENRPLACRLQLNMDFDDLLCKLVAKDVEYPIVPYLDTRHQTAVAAHIFDKKHDDIRNWFTQVSVDEWLAAR